MSKADILEELQRENANFEALLGEVGEDRMSTAWVADNWSIKDIVAHMAGWREKAVGKFRAAASGEPTPPPPWPSHLHEEDENDLDDINAWLYEQSKDKSPQEVMQRSRDVYHQLFEAIAAMPDEFIEDPTKLGWEQGEVLNGASLFGHFHDEHEQDIQDWLARNS